ncbi:MAG: hypothetical protein MUF48_15815, partial [Pirellulaceae bacterium]|nr:hypothetical protein [Pirellulaceae bacterium]
MFDLAELEDRILLSAAPLPADVDVEQVAALDAVHLAADGSSGPCASWADAPHQPDAEPLVVDAPAASTSDALLPSHAADTAAQPHAADTQLAATFDAESGLLTILGTPADDGVDQSFTPDGFLVLRIGDAARSAQPLSTFYDPALAGATQSTLQAIVMLGQGGQDSLTLSDQSLDHGLVIHTDSDLVVAGAVRVGHGFHAEAATIEVGGSVTAHGGHVALHSTVHTVVDGLIDVSSEAGGRGGRIEIWGPTVLLTGSAVVDASGDTGGGIVLVGGDHQGHNGDLANAEHTLLGTGSLLRADALHDGDGGHIVVWADATTWFYGTISARGSASGDGGHVEVSGNEFVEFRGCVDISAVSGHFGTLLLDPTDIVIANGTGDSAADGTNRFQGDPSALLGAILAADIGPTTIYESELQGMAATAHIILQATNNITIHDLADNTLSLAATTGSLTIHADFDGDGAGAFSMNAGDTIRTQGGAVTIHAAELASVGSINTSGTAGVAGGAVTLTADVGGISVSGSITTTGGSNQDGGSVTVTGSGPVSVGGAVTTSAGTYAAGNPGRNAGHVTITGSSVAVAAITAAGTS